VELTLHQCHVVVDLDNVARASAGTDGRLKSSGVSDCAGFEDLDTALAPDPDYRAAQLMRQCVTSTVEPGRSPVPRASASSPNVAPIAPSRIGDGPPASADGYAQLEQRVRRRRVDGRIEAAWAALAQRRFDDAAAALDELVELDPGLPILGELTAELNQQRDAAIGHRDTWIAAAAACALAVALFALGMSSSPIFKPSISHRFGGSALTVAPTLPAPAIARAAGALTDKPIAEPASPGSVEPSTVVEARPRRSETLVEQDRLPTVSTPRPFGFAGRDESSEPAQPPPEPLPRVQEPTAAVAITSPAPPASASIPIDDEALIRQTLRRYRDAYRTLNAQSALAVQPTADQASLARAFDGLQEQSLVFDACQMEVLGSSAMAICRGAARYAPKVGRREPRTERRVWSFTLNKHDGDWTIETARADQ
jgi:hypothetical protein